MISARQVLHLCVVAADRPIRYIVHTGTRDQPHSTGLGKALLANLDPELVDRILSENPLEPKTPHTITVRGKLDAELKKVRKNGWAYDDQEGALGLCCFAFPVLVDGRCVAAVSVSGPPGELPRTMSNEIVPELETTAKQLAGDSRLPKALVAITPA